MAGNMDVTPNPVPASKPGQHPIAGLSGGGVPPPAPIRVSAPDAEAWFSAMFRGERDGVLLVAQGRIAEVNEACVRLLGYEGRDDLLGKPLTWFADDEDAQRLSGAGRPATAVAEVFTFSARRRDGSRMLIEASRGASQLEGESRSVLLLRDVTARTDLEAQLRQAQKMEAVGHLASGVAHDFNNLLTAIRCQTEAILTYEPVTPSTKEMLQQVVGATQRAAELTRRLSGFSRAQAMQPTAVDLNALVASLTKLLQRLISEEIALSHQLAAQVPLVYADPGMIEQVIINLTVNARDALPQGGRVTISTIAQAVSESQARQHPGATAGEFAVIEVRDNGTGIAPQHLPRIFDAFFTTKEAGKGTGLGLATVAGIVQQHHGWVEVDSVVGTGTAFRVFLPARRDLVLQPAAAETETAVVGGQETLLVVEDDPQLRKLVRLALQRLGYTVLEAASGVETLQLWEREAARIQLLLLDLVLPDGLSGWELLQRLRKEQPGLRAILTSGYSAPMSEGELKAVPGVRFLSKPFDPAALARMVRCCLDEPESTRDNA
jgi:two-component system, cell cycle sensor histidine kinase and response regulator CckA